ncbi:hypothetical protein I4U23_031018 [Adineta vaga]|nr:hypothetical protein I4U23_031018 [Adineta vaga]
MNDSTVLSHIYLCESLCYSSGKIRPSDCTERSKLLSSLALLLNGNASCTAVYVHQGERCVFVSRNDPIAATDERYFNGFFRLIRIYANLCFSNHQQIADEVRDQLRCHVLECNSKKIIHRFIGRNEMIIDRLQKMLQWNQKEKDLFISELQSNSKLYKERPLMTEKLCLIDENQSEEDYVQFLFDQLAEFITVHENTGAGVYYFEKISAHDRSLHMLLKYLHVRTNYVIDLYKNITLKLISSIETIKYLSVTPRQAFENIFTNLCHLADGDLLNILSNMKSETFYNEHLDKLKRIDNNPNQSVHIHAEILPIDH